MCDDTVLSLQVLPRIVCVILWLRAYVCDDTEISTGVASNRVCDTVAEEPMCVMTL